MAIQYEFRRVNDILWVQATGFDENLEDVKKYGLAIIEEALAGNFRMVLCDERSLEYRLGIFDTFTAGAFIVEAAPRVAKVAIVCNARNISDASFWETVVINRGLEARVFKEIEAAQAWLLGD